MRHIWYVLRVLEMASLLLTKYCVYQEFDKAYRNICDIAMEDEGEHVNIQTKGKVGTYSSPGSLCLANESHW